MIRKATEADHGQIVILGRQFAALSDRDTLDEARASESIRQYLVYPGADVLVEGDPVSGFALILYEQEFTKELNAHMSKFYPARTGLRCGRELLAAVVDTARQRGAAALYASGNALERPYFTRLFRNLGFEELAPVMVRTL